jgi:hypothetical protein
MDGSKGHTGHFEPTIEARLFAVSAGEFVFALVAAGFLFLGGWSRRIPAWELVLLIGGELCLSFVSFNLALGKSGWARLLAWARDIWSQIRSVITDDPPDPAREPTREADPRNLHRLQRYLGIIAFINFLIAGRLIALSGGIAVSPFAQFAFTMTVLGMAMVREIRTRRIFVGLGIAFFLLVTLGAFGASRAEPSRGLEVQICVATIINLLTAFGFAKRLSALRGTEPLETTPREDEAGG